MSSSKKARANKKKDKEQRFVDHVDGDESFDASQTPPVSDEAGEKGRRRRRTTRDSQDEQRSGRRVGDIKAQERAERNRKIYRRYIMRIAIVIAAVLLVVFGSIFIYRSSLFTIKHIEVKGVEHLSDAEITRLAAVPDDSTLLRLDKEDIVERLKEHAWIEEADISRKFPDALVITIVEREPAAAVRIDDKTIWVISNDGTWLSAATKNDWNSFPRISQVSAALASPVAGSNCNDEGITNAIKVYKSISDDLRKQVKTIYAESAAKTTLALTNGVTVAFGEAADVELKEAGIWKLLKKYKDTISYINVRVPSRPAYRTLKAS